MVHFGGLSIVRVTFLHCVQLNFSELDSKEVQVYCVYTAQIDLKAFPNELDLVFIYMYLDFKY